MKLSPSDFVLSPPYHIILVGIFRSRTFLLCQPRTAPVLGHILEHLPLLCHDTERSENILNGMEGNVKNRHFDFALRNGIQARMKRKKMLFMNNWINFLFGNWCEIQSMPILLYSVKASMNSASPHFLFRRAFVPELFLPNMCECILFCLAHHWWWTLHFVIGSNENWPEKAEVCFIGWF